MLFHLMPWPYVPSSALDEHPSVWVTYPNDNYDADRGAQLYGEYLDQLCYAEELGFDTVCVNEHHQTAYGLMPSPNVVASAIIQRTSSIGVAILGNCIALRDHPLRVAEEVAMLDVMSRGRVISGFVRGIGHEYHTFGIDPNMSQPRFYEAHDLIVKAWTDPGPFRWHGEYYRFEYVNPWPRPYQKPHPPIWIPSQGSLETSEWVADHHYTILQTFNPIANIVRVMQRFRETCVQRQGYLPHPEQMGWMLPVYVGQDDESAHAEARGHLDYLNQRLQTPRRRGMQPFPPGYLTERSMANMLQRKGPSSRSRPYEELIESGWAVAGGPASVRERLLGMAEESGCGVVIPLLQFGDMPHERAIANMERFASQVLPALKEFSPDRAEMASPSQG